MENVQTRKRSFNINALAVEEAECLSDELGTKVRQICDQACVDANKILNIYGMKAQMQIAVQPLNEESPSTPGPQPKKKGGRPRKDTQSLS